MKIIQEETTPIGNFYHDSGVHYTMMKLESIIDDFELDSEDIVMFADEIISSMKKLKTQVKKIESETRKADFKERISFGYGNM